ncbi:MAG: hypothetical protein HQ582_11685 [Planctomycetes bacterium]|nr:hypothetical protein [Planctomycetota bacterium]
MIPHNRETLREYVLMGLFAISLGGLLLVFGGPSSMDDTWIYLRYVKNVLEGQGWVYNLGEHVNALTSPLWGALLLLPCRLFGVSLGTAHAVSFAVILLEVALLLQLFRRLGHKYAPAACLTVLVLAEPHSLRHGFTGMEGPLVTFSMVLVSYLALVNPLFSGAVARRNHGWLERLSPGMLGVACGLLPAIRPELGALMLGFWAWLVLRTVRVQRQGVATVWSNHKKWVREFAVGFGISLGLYLLLTVIAFGSPVPSTALAKSITLQQQQGLGYSALQTTKIVLSSCWGAWVALPLVAWLMFHNSRRLRATKKGEDGRLDEVATGVVCVLLAQSLATYSVLASSGSLVSTRYASVLSFPCVLVFAIIVGIVLRSATRWSRYVVICALIVQLVGASFTAWYVFPGTRVRGGDSDCGLRQIGEFVRENTPTNARIATTEIGIIGFYSERYIVDPICLVHKDGLEFWRRHGGRSAGGKKLEEFLEFKGATHYVAHHSREMPEEGSLFCFKKVASFEVVRNNLSHGRKPRKTVSTLYALERKGNDSP